MKNPSRPKNGHSSRARSAGLLLGAAALVALVPGRADASWLSGLLSLFHPSGRLQPKAPGVTGPLSLRPGTGDELRDLLAQLWPRMSPNLDKGIRAALAAQAGQQHGALTVEKLVVSSLDLAAPPFVAITPRANGSTYLGETVEVQLPGDPAGWAIAIDGRIAYALQLGPLSTTLREDFTVQVAHLRARDDADLDTATDPAAPTIQGVHHPVLDFDLTITAPQSALNALLAKLKPVIHDAISRELESVFKQFDPLLASLQGKPGAPWGVGGPALAPFGQHPDLHQAALDASSDIQNDQTPFGTLYQATFSDPTYHQGTVVGWDGMGDSPIWTGSYLAGEAFRFALTGDAAAETDARKVVDGIRLLLDVQDPSSGRLSRYAIPLSDPFAQTVLPIGGYQWIATVNGQQYVCDEDISRDQHDGVMLGVSVGYDLFQDPQLKADCAKITQRIVDFLESTGWNALRRDGTVSAPFVQSPCAIVGYTAAAERTDPVKYGPMRAKHGRIASFDWLGTWLSTMDVQDQYYKWNLGHTTSFLAMRLETDPDRYRALDRSLQIMRRCVGHHRNSWFDGVEAALDPARRAALGPQVTEDLERLVSRGRRDRPVTNSQDPTIEQATYSGFLQVPGGGLSVMGLGIPLGTQQPFVCAKYPVPVEKRPNSDFEWQRNPFDLDGGGDPRHQGVGCDIVLPYWLGRYDGFIP